MRPGRPLWNKQAPPFPSPHILNCIGGWNSLNSVFLVLLLFTVSLDGLAVGLAFGLSRIRMGLVHLLLISGTSCLIIVPALLLGEILGSCIPHQYTAWLSGGILMGLGMILLWQGNGKKRRIPTYRIHRCRPWPLGRRLLYILRNPYGADLDCSGSISTGEAILLGIALALDAFGAVFGMALTGIPVLYTVLGVGLSKFLCTGAGYVLGQRVYLLPGSGYLAWFPGLILMGLGLLKVLGV